MGGPLPCATGAEVVEHTPRRLLHSHVLEKSAKTEKTLPGRGPTPKDAGFHRRFNDA